MEHDPLLNLGLTQTEATVYRTLCALGSATAYTVAKHAKLYKANTYAALKRLENEGLVSTSVMSNKTHYEAADPAALIRTIEQTRHAIEQEIPKLRTMQLLQTGTSDVNIYRGRNAFHDVLYGLLAYNSTIYAWGIPKETPERIGPRINDFHKERIRRKIQFKHIYNYEATERIRYLLTLPYTPTRRLTQQFDSNVITLVGGPEILLIAPLLEPMKTIRIRDKELADAYKHYFTLLWKNAKPYT